MSVRKNRDSRWGVNISALATGSLSPKHVGMNAMDGRLPLNISGTHYRLERLVGGSSDRDGTPVTHRWGIYEREGETDRRWQEDRPAPR